MIHFFTEFVQSGIKTSDRYLNISKKYGKTVDDIDETTCTIFQTFC